MNETLPLFQELPRERVPSAEERAPAPATLRKEEVHLRAARRISRSMWRYPERSPEQTRAGIAICHHLQALLAQSERR